MTAATPHRKTVPVYGGKCSPERVGQAVGLSVLVAAVGLRGLVDLLGPLGLVAAALLPALRFALRRRVPPACVLRSVVLRYFATWWWLVVLDAAVWSSVATPALAPALSRLGRSMFDPELIVRPAPAFGLVLLIVAAPVLVAVVVTWMRFGQEGPTTHAVASLH